jgi:glycosyltransferase involved in cell wall biosynthesis
MIKLQLQRNIQNRYIIVYLLFLFFAVVTPLVAKQEAIIRAQVIFDGSLKEKYTKKFLTLEQYFKKYGLVFVTSHPDVILCTHLTNDIIAKHIPVILLKRRSSGSILTSTKRELKHEVVKAVFQNRTLKNTTLCNEKCIQNCYHFNLINQSAQIIDLNSVAHYSCMEKELEKIRCVLWSLENSPLSDQAKLLKNIKIKFDQERPIDVFFAERIYLKGNSHARKLYSWHRKKAVEKLKEIKGINIVCLDSNQALSFEEYIATMQKSKIVVSPWGTGEWAHRDYEAMHCGAILLKPDTGFLQAIPDIYQNNITYVPCLPDFSDLEDKIREILSNYSNYNTMRTYAKQLLVDCWDMKKIAYDFVKAVREALAS